MRLVALVESPDHVCTRYRVRAFEPQLRAAGHELELQPFPADWWGRLTVANRERDADAVVLQRRLLSRPEVAILRRRARRLCFDLDDAVWMRDSYSSKGFASWKRVNRFRTIVRAADAVIAGNDYLAENATRAGARSACVIPTCVDVKSYPVARHAGSGVELVWVGSSSTLRGLEAITPMLETVGHRVPGARLKLVCDHFLRLKDLPVIEAPWSDASERDQIAAADIGISWVPDDPWSRGKCGLKVLQYMAAGLPVVTNPVGVHPEMVRHGETGFLATTEAEWIEAIQTLARDPNLRRRMGARGREVVTERYSVEVGAAKWVNLLSALTTGRATA
ncbi:MAG TPA: glycosyltransferase family 4 protein [Gemmataceae bacterium]|nr:glycosyltransferase family 4 protein [Gemmataceae bacterium]